MSCASCDGELVPGATFCGHCGARIEPVAAPPDPVPADDDLETGAVPVEVSAIGARRPRRARYLVAMAAVVALVAGVALAWPDSGGDDQVAAEGATSTTTAGGNRIERRDDGQSSVDEPAPTEETVPGDPAAPDPAGVPVVESPPAASGAPDAGFLTAAPPAQGGAPGPVPAPTPPPPPPPPPPSPPGPAALLVVSDCVERCVIDRGGRVELRVINFGGLSGRFTVEVSDGLDPRPRQAWVGGGETRVVELVETAGKRRAYRVDVLDDNGVLLFRTSVSVGG